MTRPRRWLRANAWRLGLGLLYAVVWALVGRVGLGIDPGSPAAQVAFFVAYVSIPFLVAAVVQRWWAALLPLSVLVSTSVFVPAGTVYDDSFVVVAVVMAALGIPVGRALADHRIRRGRSS